MYTVKLRHTDKSAKCRFFVLPRDDPELPGIPDTELLNILMMVGLNYVLDLKKQN